jgi:2,5-diketo-D-gluconate reductase A
MRTTLTLNNGVDRRRARRVGDGYRHVDTAAAHRNEREVGRAIRDSGVDRSEVFIETKVWISDYGYDPTLHAFAKSAGKLGVDLLDLLILHQALPSAFDRSMVAYQALEAARRRTRPRHRRQQLHARSS